MTSSPTKGLGILIWHANRLTSESSKGQKGQINMQQHANGVFVCRCKYDYYFIN